MSAPYVVSPPTLEQVGSDLVAHNGSWRCDSGPVVGCVFVFLRGGEAYWGWAPPPFIPITGQQPALDNNTELLMIEDYGATFQVEVYGATRSKYVRADGTVAYDGFEYGGPALTNTVIPVKAMPPPPGPTPADIVAAETWLGEAVNSLKQSYAWTHTTAASYAQVHASADSIAKAVAFLRGTS